MIIHRITLQEDIKVSTVDEKSDPSTFIFENIKYIRYSKRRY